MNKDYVLVRPNTAINIIEPIEENHSFQITCEELEKILKDHANKKICVIGIAGRFRKGKSFLMNYFIRYLDHITTDPSLKSDWIGKWTPKNGFSSRGGSERDTTGILLWSQPFVIKDKNNEDMVVLLMDTQGIFDQQSSFKYCTTIFALSTMISSVQIYNLQNNIHEDDLDNLQYFVGYGRMAQEGEIKPFQSLVFLIRDWPNEFEYRWGFNGGGELLDIRMKTTDNDPDGKNLIRDGIKMSFEDIKCFLMPHPGLELTESNNDLRGRHLDIRDKFKQYLDVFTRGVILNPQTLNPNKINGEAITCSQFIDLIKKYSEIFKSGELPEPKTRIQLMNEMANEMSLKLARETYINEMRKDYWGNAMSIAFNLKKRKSNARKTAFYAFNSVKKIPGNAHSKDYFNKLDNELQKLDDKAFNYKKLFLPMAIQSASTVGIGVGLVASAVALPITGGIGIVVCAGVLVYSLHCHDIKTPDKTETL